MLLNKYDIILCKNSKSPISKMIYFFTKDIYNHSELYIGGYHIIDGMPNGVNVRNFDNRLGDFDAFRYYKPITKKQGELIEEFLQRALNTKYDFVELLGQMFKRKTGSSKKFICISLIVNAFKYAGLEIDDWQIGFKQISDSKYFIKVNN